MKLSGLGCKSYLRYSLFTYQVKKIYGKIYVTKPMDWVQDANKNNVLSVEDGLGQINGAKDEADKIGRMQTDSKEMAMQVLDASKETEQFAHKLGDTSERLKELVASLREQTGQVVEQGKSQRKVTEEVENAFLGVEQIAGQLVEIAGTEVS